LGTAGPIIFTEFKSDHIFTAALDNVKLDWLQKAEGLLKAVDQTAKAVSTGQQTTVFRQKGINNC